MLRFLCQCQSQCFTPVQARNGSGEQGGRPGCWNRQRHLREVLPVRRGSSRGRDLALPPLLLSGQRGAQV